MSVYPARIVANELGCRLQVDGGTVVINCANFSSEFCIYIFGLSFI